MTLDAIIEKYGMHELDIDKCKVENDITTVYWYCHQHYVGDEFMVNHYLKISGKIVVLEYDVDDDDIKDLYLHCAYIEKLSDTTYEIYGVGGWIKFSIDRGLTVEELEDKDYEEQTR